MRVDSTPLTFREAGWRTDWRAGQPVAHRFSCQSFGETAVAEFHHYPDHTSGIVFPGNDVPATHAETTYHRVCEACVKQALRERPTALRCVLASDSFLQRLLPGLGFEAIDQLIDWKRDDRSLTTVSPAPWTFNRIDAGVCLTKSGPISPDPQQLSQLLSRIFADSEDLAGLPAPVPDDLLKLWSVLSAPTTLMTASHTGKHAGIAVWQSPAKNRSHVHIEYLGVHPEFRRRGLATALLQQILRDAWSTDVKGNRPGCDEKAIRVTSAASNAIATAFYSSRHFEQNRVMTLWARDVFSERG